MTIVEVTKLIDDPTATDNSDNNNIDPNVGKLSLTLKKDTESGYYLLRPLVSLLAATDNDISGNSTIEEQEDKICNKYGILVDTDDAGKKWIMEDKMFHLLDLLNILPLFKDEFPPDEVEVNNGRNENANNEDGNSAKMVTGAASFHHGNISPSLKRLNEFQISIDSHRHLGSPLKKQKIINNQNEQGDIKKLESIDTDMIHGELDEKPIIVFNHDLRNRQEFLSPSSLKLLQSFNISSEVDNDQRLKLESFLQRLLFPETRDDDSHTNEFGISNNDNTTFESLLHQVNLAFPNTPLNLNIPVDEHGNTPLHWLTTIANITLVKNLVENGADRLIGDNSGESPLVKAVKSVNNYESGTFEELLDYLYPCLILKDSINRTILHHIVITSGMTGCAIAAKYYLDILMGWIVKKQMRKVIKASNNNDNDDDTAISLLQNLDLKWIINNMLNAQDSNGDTCLNIAARLGNVSIVDSLLEYGCDPYIGNKSGLRPADFGAGGSKLQTTRKGSTSVDKDKENKESVLEQLRDSEDLTSIGGSGRNEKPDTKSLINDLQELLNTVSRDYENEVKSSKERLINLHRELKVKREELSNSREKLNRTKQLKDEYSSLKEQLYSIQNGIAEQDEDFKQESMKLGISEEDTLSIEWDSNDFDADEPFRIKFIFDHLSKKLTEQYDNDIEKLIADDYSDDLLDELKDLYTKEVAKTDTEDDLVTSLPPVGLLRARINAYKRNDEYLKGIYQKIQQKHSDLENKFRRVLSLCLKIDENKVDDMLDGLLQAISYEDPHEINTNEMQDFLKKHSV
ncbi:transcriptional regulator SWI6 NDAI_0A00600 [Naumovozyma dairenensis CBS 421]|uniref:Swi6 N-terminal domain-containing protein n=1 Tax=Naumovozyma dairenensis (strain ATCC 10597 / BCRC 20456 / CBS 421 / NBRC 0211 / NRRL Y-12639) TaxID=1071378 RepID=G0W330_NAUDC|nr:hypothetical protein NDAI_0A00600 [Naumovozyma dairenensis CBS 421]CCD22218.1 hypothetical protein NDAI_0A00600 [Naumovozyma dairenensis CBS 421]